jgi:hypothetical protein
VTFGGLKNEVAYDDHALGIDPDIQQMFYGPEPGQPDESGQVNDLRNPDGDAAP